MDRPTLIIALIGLVGCGLAVATERLVKRPLMSAHVVTLAWALALGLAFYFQYERLPPVPWTAGALDNEPWEALVRPLLAVALAWPAAWLATTRVTPWRLWAALALAAVPLLAAVPTAERFQALSAGNAAWTLAALLAVGANYLSLERLAQTGAGRWSLLVPLAQLLTATALVMTCYGSWGDWCKLAAVGLGVITLSRLALEPKPAEANGPAGLHTIILGLPVLTLSAGVLMHIRDYSEIALPTWLAPLVLLIPTLVNCVDAWIGVQRPAWLRVVIAAVTAMALCGGTLATVLAQSSSE